MESEITESRCAKIWKGEDGIIRVFFLPHTELTLEDAREIDRITYQMTGENKFPILVDLKSVKSIDRDVRKYGSNMKTQRVASAILIGTPLSRVFGNIYLGVNKPAHPVKLFASENEAIEWLKGYIE